MSNPKRIIALDGDIPAYAIGFKSEGEPVENALHSVKIWIDKCLRACDAEHYIIFLTGKGNFREERATIQPYKENRKDQRKPEHHKAIRDYMIEYHGAVVIDGAEADDALGIFATEKETGVEKVICTLDKDLDMIPGLHYNWRKDLLYNVTEKEAENFFIKQLLTGDSTDNIPGLYKLTGKKASKKIVQECILAGTFKEKIDAVERIYISSWLASPDVGPIYSSPLDEIGDLLWIQRDGAETWKDYYEQQISDTKSSKSKSKANKEESS